MTEEESRQIEAEEAQSTLRYQTPKSTAEDLYDFPVSNTFRNGLIAMGFMPNYGYVDIPSPRQVVAEQEPVPAENKPWEDDIQKVWRAISNISKAAKARADKPVGEPPLGPGLSQRYRKET